jgi:hypothetical protein
LVIAAMVLAILGFGGVSFYFYQSALESSGRQRLSEQNALMAHQDIGKFHTRGGSLFRQKGLGWFLLEWHEGRIDRAREIQSQVDAGSSEHAAMAFLLDDAVSLANLQARLPPSADAMAHFVAGERYLKAGRTDEAIREFEQSAQAQSGEYEWYVRSARARLQQLHGPRKNPAATLPGG